jgi:hypothetical protein
MRNRKRYDLAAVGFTLFIVACGGADTTSPEDAALLTNTGTGAPSGAHYNLNLIGVANGLSPNMDAAAGV